MTTNGRLFDPLLSLLASQVDDLETLRIASENRYRQLTGTDVDTDGVRRTLGLPTDHSDVARVRTSLDGLAALEMDAIRHLERHVRRSAWGPWVKTAPGVGAKQLARLLASIGDPYWNTLHDRPRTVSELWAYCGMHTTPAPGHGLPEAHRLRAGGGPRTAPRRQRGQIANWSEDARKRAWLIATSCVKTQGRYRTVYDDTRAHYDGAVHDTPCVRCGPSGHPAQPGSPLSPGHEHARALRKIAKTVLRDLWREARAQYPDPDSEVAA